MSASILSVRNHISQLLENLGIGANLDDWYKTEKLEDVAEVVSLMAELAGSLSLEVTNFINGWDFLEDCRRTQKRCHLSQ